MKRWIRIFSLDSFKFLSWEVQCWYPPSFIMCYNSKFMFIVWKKGKIASLKSKSKLKSMFLLYQYSDFILDVWLISFESIRWHVL